MLVLNRRPKSVRTESRTTSANPAKGLQAVAVGLGTVQLLLDIGRMNDAKATLRGVRNELQALRRSEPA